MPQENNVYLQQVWNTHNMQLFNDFLRWYSNKDVAPTLEPIKKRFKFITTKALICWIWVVAYRNGRKSAFIVPKPPSFTHFQEGDKDLQEKVREGMVGEPSIVFNRKAVVDKTRIRSSTNDCKVLMLVNSIHTLFVSWCLLDCTHAGNSMMSYSDSNQDPTRQDRSNIWIWPNSKIRVRVANYRVFAEQELRSNLLLPAWKHFVVPVRKVLRPWVVFMIFWKSGSKICSHRWRHFTRTTNGGVEKWVCSISEKKNILPYRHWKVKRNNISEKTVKECFLFDQLLPSNDIWYLKTCFPVLTVETSLVTFNVI